MMLEYQVPEMKRKPLEDLILQIRLLRLGTPSEFLHEAVEAPEDSAIATSLRSLRAMKSRLVDW